MSEDKEHLLAEEGDEEEVSMDGPGSVELDKLEKMDLQELV